MVYLELKMQCLFICLILIFTGCTVTIEPIPKHQPVKHSTAKKRHHAALPKKTPTPTPVKAMPPLHLEPTDRPTPMIHVPPQVNTISYLEAVS